MLMDALYFDQTTKSEVDSGGWGKCKRVNVAGGGHIDIMYTYVKLIKKNCRKK